MPHLLSITINITEWPFNFEKNQAIEDLIGLMETSKRNWKHELAEAISKKSGAKDITEFTRFVSWLKNMPYSSQRRCLSVK